MLFPLLGALTYIVFVDDVLPAATVNCVDCADLLYPLNNCILNEPLAVPVFLTAARIVIRVPCVDDDG